MDTFGQSFAEIVSRGEKSANKDVMTSSAEPTTPPNRPAKSSFERRAARIVIGAIASVLILVLAWVAAQLLLRRPYPPLLYTEADLPKLPASADNGWELLKNELHAVGDLGRPAKEITEISDPKATFTDRWTRATAQAQKLSNLARDEKTKQWLGVIDKVAAHPRFVDACPITFEPDCPRSLQFLYLHQMQEAVVLHDALEHRWKEAFVRAEKMMRLDVEFLPSSRSILTQAISRAHVHRTMKLVDVLLDGVALEKQPDQRPDAARLTQLANDFGPLLNAIHEEDLAPLRAVIAEYLFSAYALDQLAHAPKAGRFSRGSILLYDPGHALEMLNDRFRQYTAFAQRDGVGDAPQFPLSRLYFLHNPTGHLAVDATRGTLETHIPAIARDRALLLKDRQALRERLWAFTNSP